MAPNRFYQFAFALATLTAIAAAEPKVLRQRGLKDPSDILPRDTGNLQQPLALEDAQSAIDRVLRSKGKHSVKVKYYTYDTYYLGDIPNVTFSSDELLEYSNFGLFNVQTANELGFLHEKDLDCGASKPNALKSSVRYGSSSPSIIHSNATALAAYGLSEFFDVIAFTWKPMGPSPDFPSISMNTWRIEESKDGEKNATLVDSMFVFWWGGGYLPADTLVPSEIFGPWGEGVNFVEIQATADEDKGLDFCMDNLVLLFHPNDGDDE